MKTGKIELQEVRVTDLKVGDKLASGLVVHSKTDTGVFHLKGSVGEQWRIWGPDTVVLIHKADDDSEKGGA